MSGIILEKNKPCSFALVEGIHTIDRETEVFSGFCLTLENMRQLEMSLCYLEWKMKSKIEYRGKNTCFIYKLFLLPDGKIETCALIVTGNAAYKAVAADAEIRIWGTFKIDMNSI